MTLASSTSLRYLTANSSYVSNTNDNNDNNDDNNNNNIIIIMMMMMMMIPSGCWCWAMSDRWMAVTSTGNVPVQTNALF